VTATDIQGPSSYPPPAEFAAQANAGEELYREADEDRLAFWAKQANRLSWAKPFTEILDWSNAPFAKWFADGKLNVAYNCVDRHVEAGHGDRVAIHWEGESGDSRSLTYSDLQAEVCKAANALTGLGLVAGDRVAIYTPLIPEAVIASAAVPDRRRAGQAADHQRRAVPPRQAGPAEGCGRRGGRAR
jgi:acetyl-CoA synthetase